VLSQRTLWYIGEFQRFIVEPAEDVLVHRGGVGQTTVHASTLQKKTGSELSHCPDAPRRNPPPPSQPAPSSAPALKMSPSFRKLLSERFLQLLTRCSQPILALQGQFRLPAWSLAQS
jgi:hypothetical protein